MAKENCTLYRDKFITDCNENCYGCCNRLYNKYVKPNASIAANKEFYNIESKGSNFLQLPKYDKLTINAKSIIINDDKISITIDKDNIDKFYIIEINGVKFVKENK